MYNNNFMETQRTVMWEKDVAQEGWGWYSAKSAWLAGFEIARKSPVSQNNPRP